VRWGATDGEVALTLWTFALRDASAGGTRLLVRGRVAFDSAATKALMAPVGLVSFVMTRGMLLGIRSRVEAVSGRSRSRDVQR
jgi:hypothetical protein